MSSEASGAALELVRGQARERRWPLGPRSYRIGRVADNDICLEDRAVSRYHARIEYSDGRFYIQDDGSSSGVFLSGERVQRAALSDGSLVRVGDCVLRFAAPASSAAAGNEVLLEVLEGLGGIRELDEVLERVLDAVMRLTGAERGFLLLTPPPGGPSADGPAGLELRLARPPAEPGTEAQLSRTILLRAIRSDALVAFGDALEDESVSDAESVSMLKVRGVVCVPLRGIREADGGQALLGAIYADNPTRSAAFSPERLEAVRALARHAALAIRNAQLFDRGRRTIEDLEVARDQALAANRAKTLFLSTMSHELHTPLNAVLGYAEMMAERLTERGDEEGLQDLARIRQAGRRLQHLIDDVLSLSELEGDGPTLTMKRFELDPLFREVGREAEAVLGTRGNAFTLDIGEGLGTMVSDAKRIRQLLWKLLSNAAKFTENGSVTLTARRGGADGDELEFSVRDTGIGMHAEQMRRIFEPFTQVDGSSTRRFEGGGLGLAVAHRLCDALGGSIGVESEPGRGSVFRVRLPTAIS